MIRASLFAWSKYFLHPVTYLKINHPNLSSINFKCFDRSQPHSNSNSLILFCKIEKFSIFIAGAPAIIVIVSGALKPENLGRLTDEINV